MSERGSVLEVSEPPWFSGYVRTWVEVLLLNKDKKVPVTVLIPYMWELQRLPKVGEICTFTFHVEDINGVVGKRSQNGESGNVADSFKCSDDK